MSLLSKTSVRIDLIGTFSTSTSALKRSRASTLRGEIAILRAKVVKAALACKDIDAERDIAQKIEPEVDALATVMSRKELEELTVGLVVRDITKSISDSVKYKLRQHGKELDHNGDPINALMHPVTKVGSQGQSVITKMKSLPISEQNSYLSYRQMCSSACAGSVAGLVSRIQWAQQNPNKIAANCPGQKPAKKKKK